MEDESLRTLGEHVKFVKGLCGLDGDLPGKSFTVPPGSEEADEVDGAMDDTREFFSKMEIRRELSALREALNKQGFLPPDCSQRLRYLEGVVLEANLA